LKKGFQDRALWTAIVVTMVLVLVALAALQYRWSKRVTEATQARIDASLKASVMDWHLSLLREIAEPCFAMQISSEPDEKTEWDKYFQRYEAWYQAAKRPQLFQNLYLIEIPKQGGADKTFRLSVDENRFYADQLPASFDALRRELRRQSDQPETLERKVTDDPTTKADNLPGQMPHDPLYGWQFEENLPALVHPLLHNDVMEDEREGHRKAERLRPTAKALSREQDSDDEKDFDSDDLEPVFWIVITLDSKILQTELLPELAQHYFGGPQGSNYDTAVIVGRTDRVLYSSSPEFTQQPFANPDAVLDIFGPPSNGGPALSHDFAGDFHSGGKKAPDSAEYRRNLTAPSWLPLLQGTAQQPHWNLVIRHRGGSLDAQMSAMRRRDLAVSSAVLLLLAATMGMLLVATRRAQRLARLQMEFVATVSHELRTPLAVICSAADNLSDGVVNGKQQLARYGQTIKIQGQQLIALVEQILLFASTREGRQVYHLEVLSVERIVDVVLTNVGGLLEVAGVRLESEIEPGLPKVVGDLAAISQCVQNLVINAVKYGGDAKWVRVAAGKTSIGDIPEIQIAVEDQGIGMSAEDIEHIFEPFYRSPQVAAAQIRGTGLGLPLARSLAEAMGGSLTVESEEGKGSTFTLHLPFAQNSPLRTSVQEPADKVVTHA
jgi:two-component system sensor histidine kinase SenX3